MVFSRSQLADAAQREAAQEHLNRALIVERAVAEQFGLEEVNVVPQPKAGGSFGTTAYKRFDDPVAVESLKQSASAGMDIGGTLIGIFIGDTLTVKGTCSKANIGGTDNKVTFDKVDQELDVVGMHATVTYKDGAPKVNNTGTGNTVSKG